MDIGLSIENIKRYFSHKLTTDEWKIESLDEYRVTINIDNYHVALWLRSGYEGFDFYEYPFISIKQVVFDFLNEDQKKLAYRNVMAAVETYKDTIKKKEIIENIARLQKELSEINK